MEEIESRETCCDQHPSELSSYFCFTHIVSLCSACCERHRLLYPEGDHSIVSLYDFEQFDLRFSALCKSLQKDPNINPADSRRLEAARKAKPTNALKIISDLFDPLKCVVCGEKNLRFVNLAQPVFACSAFHQQASGSDEWFELRGSTKEELVQVLLALAKNLLSTIPTAVLRRDSLEAYHLRLGNSEARQVRDLLYYLNQDVRNAEKMLAEGSFPAASQCLSCDRETLRKDFFQLPCFSALHEICWNCASKQTETMVLTCPIDKSTFPVDEEIERRLLQLHLEHQAAEERKKEEPPSAKVAQVSAESDKVLHVGPEVVTMTPLPPASELFPFIQLFNHVLPKFGSRPEIGSGNNKPWLINPRLNVVDAIILGIYSDVELVGMTVTTPLVPGMQAAIEFVKIYAKGEARGPPLYELPNVGVLEGGDTPCTDVWFPYPLFLSPGNYALKMKLSRGDNHEVFMLYRGSPFSRSEYWLSSLETLWDFTECKALDDHERPNGQCNLSGPFLRFYFTLVD